MRDHWWAGDDRGGLGGCNARCIPAVIVGDGSTPVSGMALDSRAVRRRRPLLLRPGRASRRSPVRAAALEAGAGGAARRPPPRRRTHRSSSSPTPGSPSGPLAATLWGHPSQRLTTIGVTGTNGKTTTTALLAAVLEQAGWPTGVLGTLDRLLHHPRGARAAGDAGRAGRARASGPWPWRSRPTPSPCTGWTARRFAVAVFTNLGRDHLDFHRTIGALLRGQGRAVHAGAGRPRRHQRGRRARSSSDGGGDHPRHPVLPGRRHDLRGGADLAAGSAGEGGSSTLPMGGRFNVANALAAATTASVLGIDDATIAAGLSAAPPVPGRMEAVEAGQPFRVVVDFAHTPDALARARCRAAGRGRRAPDRRLRLRRRPRRGEATAHGASRGRGARTWWSSRRTTRGARIPGPSSPRSWPECRCLAGATSSSSPTGGRPSPMAFAAAEPG